MMLVLFDIDGTLLLSQHAGAQCMHDATRELYGDAFTFDGVEIAGRIDPQIWHDVALANGIDNPHEHHDRFREVYTRHLARRLAGANTVRVLPGVTALLEALGAVEGLTRGLLTGNYPETGRLKIEAAGLDPEIFEVAAWGCDGRSRRDLPGVAMDRHAAATGARIAPEEVVIIGDTPHDVDCARAHGCRSLAVATGPSSRDELVACEPDLLADDLSQTKEIISWILDCSR
ncbi:MAG: HAD hydrolase-like protein [Planctomycetes bacterium]|nr:HAD hydrolase-like protein [Planctomycetota bacterium]